MSTFAPFNSRIDAQMAESVDALVSNTSRFTPVPVRPRLWVLREVREDFSFFCLYAVRMRVGSFSRWRCGIELFGRRLLLSQSLVFV